MGGEGLLPHTGSPSAPPATFSLLSTSQAPMRVFLHCQDCWPPGLGLDGRIPLSLLGEGIQGTAHSRESFQTYSSPRLHLLTLICQLAGFWLSALDLFLHDFLKYSIYCPNILSPNMDMVVLSLSYLTLSTPWTVARQAPLSMGSSRQEYWSGLPFPSPEDLPNPGVEPGSPALRDGLLTCKWILYQLSYEGNTT